MLLKTMRAGSYPESHILEVCAKNGQESECIVVLVLPSHNVGDLLVGRNYGAGRWRHQLDQSNL